MKKDLIELAKDLISIPSYVDLVTDESKVGEYLLSYLAENLPWLKVKIQKVSARRFNIIALSDPNPRLLFLCHTDTVNPSSKNSLEPNIIGNKLFGLGSSDMKGGLSCAIKAIEELGEGFSAGLILDCDEEYSFLGINKLVS